MKFLLPVAILLLFSSCYQAERNCANFKTGTFEFTYTIDGEKNTSTFTRSDSLEITIIKNVIDSSSVRWINDCEFIVKKLHPTTRSEKKAIHMKILTTNENSYTFEYAIVGDVKNKQRGTAKKIK